MKINTNVAQLTALEANTQINKNLNASLERLSSGLRINKSSDDASGMAIADKLRTQASSVGQAIANGNSAVSLIQIADKAMAEQSNILDMIKQKLLQTATATTSSAGRDAIAKDIGKLLEQLNGIAQQTNYNGIYLLQKGSALNAQSGSPQLVFQMGENGDNTISSASGTQANVTGLALSGLVAATKAGASDITSTAASGAENARTFLETIDTALTQMNIWRSNFGATQNQIESAVRNLSTQKTNIKAAESVIRDVDYAQESANFNKQNIISQAGTYAISQSSKVQQNVLRLLQ